MWRRSTVHLKQELGELLQRLVDLVRLDGQKLADPNQEFSDAAQLQGKVLQLGKKTFRRLVLG
ncbi:MAG: hypothetical protein R6W06_10680 [Prochlorococcaceae cyanobacterium]